MTTVYIGNYFEWKGSTSTMVKYYYAGAERVAMRTGTANAPMWLLSDHLGSASVAVNTDGSGPPPQGYYAGASTLRGRGDRVPVHRAVSTRPCAGLYFYGARWYDSALGRFAQADTIVPNPGNPAAFDRYAYGSNNPLRYTDPTGYITEGEGEDADQILKQLLVFGVKN